ncbi:MAG: beta-lactamase family protein [Ilumatobacter sp.]|nr:beta-lactamase family protein [Ilumatobacter sp.]
MTALDRTADWPVPTVAAAVLRSGAVVSTVGPQSAPFRLASLAKPLTAWAVLVAHEEGIVDLDSPIGQPGCTLRHLLAHAGGYPFEGDAPIAAPARKRIYSNTGIELAAAAVESASAMPFADYLRLAVFEPLGMAASELRGSPAHQIWSTAEDYARFVAEVVTPTLLAPSTAIDAVRDHYPSLSGIVPGVGRYERCPWGLGFEIRGAKSPHWTGARNRESTFGHFGGAGTMFWIDPDADVAVVALTDRPFDEWASDALRRWPELSDAVLDEFASPPGAVAGTVR